jgi:hypothetical protein
MPLRSSSTEVAYSSMWRLAYREDIDFHPGLAKLVNNHWIDANMVRNWISSCDATHGQKCRKGYFSRKEDNIRPKYLVDTTQNCLVNGHTAQTAYVALSYQWGQTHNLRNNSQLCERLLLPGSLTDMEIAADIPQTIRDATAVVELSGYRYLWVDALCIVSLSLFALLGTFTKPQRVTGPR